MTLSAYVLAVAMFYLFEVEHGKFFSSWAQEELQAARMDMFSMLSLEDGKEDTQVKKRKTEVLAVGIAADNAGANAEDERGEAEETCSEQARQEKMEKKEKKKKKEKEKKKEGEEE